MTQCPITDVTVVLAIGNCLSQSSGPSGGRRYVVVIDGGSTGTRIHVFRYEVVDGGAVLNFEESGLVSKRVSSRLSTFVADPKPAGGSLREVLEFARWRVPGGTWADTEVRLMATTGIRLLELGVQERILGSCQLAIHLFGCKFRDDWASIITAMASVDQRVLLTVTVLLLLLLSLSVESEQDTPISRFQRYLRINTAHPNPDYGPAISFLQSEAESIPDLQSQVLEFSPGKPLLLLTWSGSDPFLPSLLFNSHLDSVPAEPHKWLHPPFSATRTPDGKIFARGAQDDKSIATQYLEAIRNLSRNAFSPLRTIHVSYVPDEEIGGAHGTALFVKSKEFQDLNVGFVVDEGQASPGDQFRVFYADRSPWGLIIKAEGLPGHGSRMFDNCAVENLMRSVEMITKFRDAQFDEVKAGKATNGEVISVNPVYIKAGTPSPTGFVMNLQPSEAEAGFDLRLPPTADPDLMKKRIAEEWAPATRNLTYQIIEKGPIRDNKGRPLMTATNDSNPWWSVFKQAIEATGGKLAKPEILASTTDTRFMRQLGIPALGFSPMTNTPILLHDHNEYLKDTVYLKGIEVYESLMTWLSSFDGASRQM